MVAIQGDDELLKQLIHIVYALKRTENRAYTNAAAKQSSEKHRESQVMLALDSVPQ